MTHKTASIARVVLTAATAGSAYRLTEEGLSPSPSRPWEEGRGLKCWGWALPFAVLALTSCSPRAQRPAILRQPGADVLLREVAEEHAPSAFDVVGDSAGSSSASTTMKLPAPPLGP